METISTNIWIRVDDYISYNDYCYAKRASHSFYPTFLSNKVDIYVVWFNLELYFS